MTEDLIQRIAATLQRLENIKAEIEYDIALVTLLNENRPLNATSRARASELIDKHGGP